MQIGSIDGCVESAFVSYHLLVFLHLVLFSFASTLYLLFFLCFSSFVPFRIKAFILLIS